MTTPRKQLINLFIDAGSDFSYTIRIPEREITDVTQWEFRSQFRLSSQNKDGYSFTTTTIHEPGKNEVKLSLTSDETATLEGGTYSYTVIGWERQTDRLVPSDGRHRIAEGNLTVNARITNPYPRQGSGYKVIEVPESRGPQGIQGEKGDIGSQGPKGDKGDQGPKGDKGDQGPKGDTGTTGLRGPRGLTGANSTVPGPPGADGTDGAQGPTGAQGPAGPAGMDGSNGMDGAMGTQGVQGRYDIKVFRAIAHNTGTTNSTRPATPIATSWNENSSSFIGLTTGWSTDFPGTTDLTTHDIYESFVTYNPATNMLTVFSIPFEVGTEVGPAGRTGPTGARGPAGRDGAPGSRGPAGQDGSDGAQGIQGPKGDPGDQGSEGPRGPAGVDGKTILNGTTDPDDTNDGEDGDFYINTDTDMIFGPKTNGLWGNGTSLIGPEGTISFEGDVNLTVDVPPLPTGLNNRGNWINYVNYSRGDLIIYNGVFYEIIQAGTGSGGQLPDATPTVYRPRPDLDVTTLTQINRLRLQTPSGTTLGDLKSIQLRFHHTLSDRQAIWADNGVVVNIPIQVMFGRSGNVLPVANRGAAVGVIRFTDDDDSYTENIESTDTEIRLQYWDANTAGGDAVEFGFTQQTTDTQATGIRISGGTGGFVQGPQGPQGPIGPEGPQGPQGDPGPEGPRGQQGLTGLQGPQGNPGARGPAGQNGAQGPAGPEGPEGSQGPQGDPGPAGQDGAQGPVGPRGNPGEPGQRGEQGPIGPEGPEGPAGAAGQNGTPGEPGAAGRDGSDGAQGRYDIKVFQAVAHNTGTTDSTRPATPTATSWEPTLSSFTGLTTGWSTTFPGATDLTTHDIYESFATYNPASDSLTLFAVPFEVGTEVGPTGPTGPTGAQGDPGPAGARGPAGQDGVQGPAGPRGNPGEQGIQGIQGNRGPQGEQGPRGNDGARGPQGERGPQGPQGDAGPRGLQGIQGIQGIQGETGLKGDTGDIGSAGSQILQGTADPDDANGNNGDYYIQSTSDSIKLFQKSSGSWGSAFSTITSVVGFSITHGTADPTGGSDGDFYIKTGTGASIWNKTSETWTKLADFGSSGDGYVEREEQQTNWRANGYFWIDTGLNVGDWGNDQIEISIFEQEIGSSVNREGYESISMTATRFRALTAVVVHAMRNEATDDYINIRSPDSSENIGIGRLASNNIAMFSRFANTGARPLVLSRIKSPMGPKGEKGDKGDAGTTLPTLTNGQLWVGDSDGNPTASDSLANSITKNVIRDVGPADANATASVTLPSDWASYNTMLLIFNNGNDVGNRYVPIDALVWFLTYTQTHSFRLAGQSDLTVSGNINSAITITHNTGSGSFTAGIYKCVLYNKTRTTT